MRIKLITGLILLLPFFGFSQGEFNNWYFGAGPAGAGVTFNSGSPVAIPNGVMFSGGVTVNVSDSLGNLLFFSNGHQVWNKNKVQMPNGFGLIASASSLDQGVLAVQKPYNDSIYYIFSAGNYSLLGTTYGLLYSVVNMKLDGGLGDVITGQKNIEVQGAQNAWHSVTATRHHNNKDIWIVTTITSIDSIRYASYLLDSSGLHLPPVLSNSIGVGTFDPPLPPYFSPPFSIRISSDGKLLVKNCGDILNREFCSFNPSTGQVTRRFFIPDPVPSGSINCEFSIASEFLYTSNFTSNSLIIRQYDATQTDSLLFVQSKITIDSGFYSRTCLQMGPDWKIYGTQFQQNYLSRIEYPSNLGLSCNYSHNVVPLLGISSDGLPQFVQRYKAYIHHSGNCQNTSIQFLGDIWPPPYSVHWDFGDPGSGLNNYSNLINATHTYANTGTYSVELFVRHIDNRTDTTWQTITIVASPQVSLGSDKTICTGSNATFDAGFCTGCSYEWKDITSGLTVGTNQTYTTNLTGNYCVIVTNSSGCAGRDTIQLFTTPVPSLTNNPLYDSICSGETTNIPLTSNPTGATFHWTATLTSGTITGFSADSGLVINQILINNGATAGVVTYHIIPYIGDCAGTPVDYEVTVNIGDLVDITVTASANNVCAGTTVTLIASPVNPGTNPDYQWKVNGVNTGSNAPTFTYVPANGDIVTCILTSSNVVCTSNNPALSNPITLVVNPLQSVGVTVSPSSNPVCAGTLVNFTAIPVNGGITPQYQWKVNGLIAGTNSPAYSYVPLNGDVITCSLTSNVLCPSGNPAISNTVTMLVNPILPAGITIAASANPFCSGSPVTFTATPMNGGAMPAYQWTINASNVNNANNAVFTYSPVNGDVVTCSLASSETCTSGNPAQSNPITMLVNATMPAGVTIVASSNPFCPGTTVTFNATPGNGGSFPTYQWIVNGSNAGTNSPVFAYNPANNDSVRCVMISNLNCVTSNPASSGKITMTGSLAPNVTFATCFDTVTTISAKPLKLKGGIPLGGTFSGPGVNPVNGVFTPSVAGTGLKTIFYTYTNVLSCSANMFKTILVQPNPTFTCGNNLIDIRDNKIYPTVQIGVQCWMQTNLDFGSTIVDLNPQTDNCKSERYLSNVNIQSSFYQWDELMRYDAVSSSQGICPPGWHVPTSSEWDQLLSFYNGPGLAGGTLKDDLLPNGFQSHQTGFLYLNNTWAFTTGLDAGTMFWTSTSSGTDRAVARGLNEYNMSVSRYEAARGNGFALRCIRD